MKGLIKRYVGTLFLALMTSLSIYGIATNNSEFSIACGVFGMVSLKKKMPFDYTSFCILGIGNDERGGDSCGVFIDGITEYGVKDTTKGDRNWFRIFQYDSEVLKAARGQEINVAFGHCRKASVGAIDEAHAQPVVIKDAAGHVKFVMVHNGTIYNYEELAKKYIPTVDIKGMTDSQVMAQIFYNKGYSCLSEYNGGAIFAIADYRQQGKPSLYMFQGKSKKYDYEKSVVEVERPLYFIYSIEKGTLVFSSIKLYLDVLYPDETVYCLSPNSLTKFDARGLRITNVFPREKMTQAKIYASSYSGAGYNHDTYFDSHYGFSGVHSYIRRGTTGTSTGTGTTTPSKTTTTTGATGSTTTESTSRKGFATNGDNLFIASIGARGTAKDRRYYSTKEADKLLDGKYNVSIWGGLYKELKKDIPDVTMHEVYYFAGIPLNLEHGRKYHNYLSKISQAEKLDKNHDEFAKRHMNVIRFLSMEGVYGLSDADETLVLATGLDDSKKFTGKQYTLGRLNCEDIIDGVSSENNEPVSYKDYFSEAVKQMKENPTVHIPYKSIRLACKKK